MKILPLRNTSIKIASIIALGYLTQGCGSSGSRTPDPEPAPIEYTFSLSSKLINNCGNEAPFDKLELLLQDSNWQILERYDANENGEIQFVTLDEKINYTLVAKSQTGDSSEGLSIESYYQANANSSVEYNAQYDTLIDQSGCECITKDVNVAHRSYASRSLVSTSANYTEWQVIDDRTTAFKDVVVCRIESESWPLHSFSIVGTDVNDNQIGNAAFSNNFDENNQLSWQLSAFDVAESITLSQGHQAFTTNQLFQDNVHFSLNVNEDDSNLMLFNSHDYTGETLFQSNASNTFQESSSIFGDTIIQSNHQLISTDYFASFEVNASTVKPDIDDVNFSEIQADGSYNYSAVANYPMAIISFSYIVYDAQQSLIPVQWTTYGPIEGQLPINAVFSGYEAFITDDTPWSELTVELLQSSLSQSYDDYIAAVLSEDTENFDQNLRSYYIDITK